MKAWRFSEFGGIEKLVMKEVGLRDPGPDEVKVAVSHAALNHVDRLVIGGRLKWVALPRTPGAEYVGTVLKTGGSRDRFRRGDRVAIFPKMFCGHCRYCRMGQEGVCLEAWNPERAPVDLSTNMLPSAMDGGWAEEALIPARNLVRLPDNVDFGGAVCLPLSAMTAHHLVSQLSPSKGESALVMGASGGVGHFVVQLLKHAGCTVIAAVNNASQESILRSLGADHVIPRTEVNVREKAMELTGGYGVDLVTDSLGKMTFRESIGALAPCGRYATAGTLTGPVAEIELMRIYSRQLRIIGSTTGSRRDLESVVQLLSSGRLKPVVSETVQFEQLPRALELLSKPGRTGKITVRVAAD